MLLDQIQPKNVILAMELARQEAKLASPLVQLVKGVEKLGQVRGFLLLKEPVALVQGQEE